MSKRAARTEGPQSMQAEVVESGAYECHIEAVVVVQKTDSEESLYRRVGEAVEQVAGTGGSMSLKMHSVPLYRLAAQGPAGKET